MHRNSQFSNTLYTRGDAEGEIAMKKMLCLLTCLACFASLSFANDSPQALQNAFMAALKANNVQGLADCYTSNAVNFPVGTLVGSGPESVIESWSSFFAAYKVVDASLSDTHLEIHGDTAVAWGLFTIMAEPVEGGDVVEMKGRYMDVARIMDGTWLYVADHASMPLPAPEE
jgi:ketosteroid isomerase-like protein